VEHWQKNAGWGSAAAPDMPDEVIPADGSGPTSTTLCLRYAGYHTNGDELVVRGSMEERNFMPSIEERAGTGGCVSRREGICAPLDAADQNNARSIR